MSFACFDRLNFVKERLIKTASVALILPLLATLVFLTISGPLDAYHEGAIFPPGVAVSDGLTIYEEVNHQYGFLHIYVNALVASVAGNQLLVYRLIGLAIMLVNAFLLFLILRRLILPGHAALISSATILISPAWSYTDSQSLGTLGPWPNIYGITLTLISIYGFSRAISQDGNIKWILMSSLFSTLSIASRVQFMAVVFFQTLILATLTYRRKIRPELMISWISGLVIGVGSIVSVLWSQGALDDAFEQLFIVWTLETPNSPHLGPIDFLRSLALVFFFGISSYIIWIFQYKKNRQLFGFAITVSSILCLYGILNFTDVLNVFPEDIARIARHSLGQVLFSVAVVLVASFVVLTLRDALKLVRIPDKISADTTEPVSLFLSATCLGILFQFHNINGPYLWMCIHPFIAWYYSRFRLNIHSKLHTYALGSMKAYIVFAVVASMTLAVIKVDFTRHPYSTPMLSGIHEYEEEKRDFVDANFTFLRNMNQFGKLRLDCSAGIYAVDDRGYALDGKWTWNEIPFEWRRENIETAIPNHTLVVCNPDERWSAIYRNLELKGYLELMATNNYFTAYRILKPPNLSDS